MSRIVIHAEAFFSEEDTKVIHHLMKCQCSAMHSAFQAINKHHLEGNDVTNYVKNIYMTPKRPDSMLNQRYVNDAVKQAESLLAGAKELDAHREKNEKIKVIFGGKKNWKDLINKSISKLDWENNRHSQLYSRGDQVRSGNPHIRVSIIWSELHKKLVKKHKLLSSSLLINNPQAKSNKEKWLIGKLFVDEKFDVSNFDWSCYEVRVMRKDRILETPEDSLKQSFEIIISNEISHNILITDKSSGVIGIDINPDGCAVSELNEHGNLLHHHYERNQKMQFARTDKRDYEIFLMANKIVDFAINKNKPIVIEDLKFKKKNLGKKFNRMASNFVYRKLSEAIEARASKMGVLLIKVNPAYTSDLGKLKYQKMYSLKVHSAAAMVIGRRGMGILERQTFEAIKTVTEKSKFDRKTHKRSKVKFVTYNLEGIGFTVNLTSKSWAWMEGNFLKGAFHPKKAALTAPDLALPGEGISSSTPNSQESGVGESNATTGRIGSTFFGVNVEDIFDEDFTSVSKSDHASVAERQLSETRLDL